MSIHDRQRGQAVPLVAMTLLAMALAAVAIVRVAGRSDEVARARTAADAAALAATREGRDGAERLAHANGATLVSYAADDDSVLVSVRIGRSVASARAELVVHLPP